MIEMIDDTPCGVIGVRGFGEVTVEDLSSFVSLRVDHLVASGTEIRFLVHLGPEFKGFGGGEWGELTSELVQIRFTRGAMVSDDFALTTALNALKWTLTGEVRTYRNDHFGRAIDWLTE